MWQRVTVSGLWMALAMAMAVQADLYRDDTTYVPEDARTEILLRLDAVTPMTEPVGIARAVLRAPDAVIRQLELARRVHSDANRDLITELTRLGFTTPLVQTTVVRFLDRLDADRRITGDALDRLVMDLLDTEGHWAHLTDEQPALNDFTGLECAPNQAPSAFLGPSAHQYLMRIAHPNMEFSLWRVDPETARRYPVAVTHRVRLAAYEWIDRWSQPFGSLDRASLTFTLADGTVLGCARVPSEVMRAHQDYQRETRVADKQL